MPTQYLPLGCYGKLPCWREFLEENVSYPSSRALKKWMHEGREESNLGAEETGGEKVLERAHQRFLFSLPGSVELVAGVIRPSTDQGGLRKFPFAVFTHFPRRLYGKQYALLPLALSPVWDALDDAWESLSNVASRTAFRELLASTKVPGPAPVDEVRRQYEEMQGEDAGRLFRQEDGASLRRLTEMMPGTIAELKKKGGEGGLKLELPVSRDRESACFDAAFWIELLNRQFLWRRFEPSVFLGRVPDRTDCCVLMLFGMMMGSDYPLIMMGGGEAAAGALKPAHGAGTGEAQAVVPEGAVTYKELSSRRFARS